MSNSGLVGIIHWNYDPETPRGPEMNIRPRPEQCRQWAEQAGFKITGDGIIDLPPYHYGMALKKNIAPGIKSEISELSGFIYFNGGIIQAAICDISFLLTTGKIVSVNGKSKSESNRKVA